MSERHLGVDPGDSVFVDYDGAGLRIELSACGKWFEIEYVEIQSRDDFAPILTRMTIKSGGGLKSADSSEKVRVWLPRDAEPAG